MGAIMALAAPKMEKDTAPGKCGTCEAHCKSERAAQVWGGDCTKVAARNKTYPGHNQHLQQQ